MNIFAFADEASSNIDEQIIAMKENGLQGMEIRNVDGVNIADITKEKAYEVKEKMDNAGLKVWSIGSPIGKIEIENSELHIEKFKNVLEAAKILGAENIRLFSLYKIEGREPEAYVDDVIAFLKKLVELSKEYDVTLCHENEKGIFGDVPERCQMIHKAIPEIKAIFDPANYIQCGVDTLKAWEMIKPYIKYLHIKDAFADGNVVPAGKGVGNLQSVVKEFMEMGGNAVTIEPHLAVFEGLAELENENDKSVVGEVYAYPNNRAAFDAAVSAFKELI